MFRQLISFICIGLGLIVFPEAAGALDTQVLSNFNQPTSGNHYRLGVRDLTAIPFTTDATYTEFDAVELPVQTWYGTGGLQVSIWSVNAANQPDVKLATLSGPTNPTGFGRYEGPVSLSANKSYFLVLGVANGGSPIIVPAIDDSGADSTPNAIWGFGVDTSGDGNADRINRCGGSRANDYVTITWSCDYPRALVYYPKIRFLAEVASPPVTYSLASTPNPLSFTTTAVGLTSAPLAASISNDGTSSQTLGTLSVPSGSRFSISSDTCSGATLAVGASCSVDVVFGPDHGGRTVGTLSIPGDASDTRSPYSLPLVGESDEPATEVIDGPDAPSVPVSVPTLPAQMLLILVGCLSLLAAHRKKAPL